MKALIFDLRGNPGGLLNVARDVASRFIEKGPLVWIQEKNGKKVSLDVEPDKHESGLDKGEYPLVVLVNGGSASASEIVAGALRDRERATLLGEKSFGKGSVQTVERLSDNSSARITIAHWLTPKRAEIHKIGITPRYVVLPATDEQYRVKVQLRPTDPPSVNDAQLWWAIKLLTTKETPPPPPPPTPTPVQ